MAQIYGTTECHIYLKWELRYKVWRISLKIGGGYYILYELNLKALRVKPSSSKTFKHNTTRIFALKLILVPIR